MGFGGGSSKPMAGEQLQEKQKADAAAAEAEKSTRRAREDASAQRARRRRGAGTRSLLSPTREEAQTGLSTKLGGGS